MEKRRKVVELAQPAHTAREGAQETTLGRGGLSIRNIGLLIAILALAKGVIFAITYLVTSGAVPMVVMVFPEPQGVDALLRAMSTDWDGILYQQIAFLGYPFWIGSEFYAFSPFFPALIYAVKFLTGSYWTAALVLSNGLGFVFPIVVLRIFNFRTALLVELFPTYLLFTMVGYSDALALVFLGLSLLFFVERRYLATGVAIALAGFVFYDLLIVVVAFLGYLLFEGWRTGTRRVGVRVLASLTLPVLIMGVGILVFYGLSTGNPFTFFVLEHAYWDVYPTTPVGQALWIFYGSGPGSFTEVTWSVLGLTLTSWFWLVRNLIFEAFFLVGIYGLSRLHTKYRWLLLAYAIIVTVPLLFVQGTPVYSIPRLFLAAFPVFLWYSQRVFTKRWQVALYGVCSVAVACWALFAFLYAFFA